MKHLFIINPFAGSMKGNATEVEREIRAFAKSHLTDPYEIYITKATMDASEKISKEAESEESLHVYACGGDGTLNECTNGAAKRENVAITHYPCGTGNDFLKTFGPKNIELFRDLKAITNGSERKLDLIDCNGRYCINICSVGIDARVTKDVHKYSGIPVIGGATGYVIALLVNVIKGVKQKFKITTESGTTDREITLACACNGRFYGGGFNPIPDAVPDDEVIDFLVVEPVSRLKVAQVVGQYAKGRFREFPHLIKYERGSYMEIGCDKEFVVNIDGEAIFYKSIRFELLPKSINFIFPAGMDYTTGSSNIPAFANP